MYGSDLTVPESNCQHDYCHFIEFGVALADQSAGPLFDPQHDLLRASTPLNRSAAALPVEKKGLVGAWAGIFAILIQIAV